MSLKKFSDIDEVISVAQRAKLARRMALLQPKIARSKKIKQNRLADRETLEKRANKMARAAMANRMLGGKSLNDLSPQEKIQLAKKLDAKKGVIKKLAQKAFKKVKEKERERLASLRKSKSENS